MLKICIAELCISIDNKYEYIKKQSADYLTDAEETDFCVCVSEDEISAEAIGSSVCDRGYLESLAIYRKIAEKIVEYDGFLMHGVVLDVKGTGIAFLGKSGVGKTTHARLWCELLKDDITIINGDKPIVRIIDNKAYAYGTPWAGKEKMQTNARVELTKLCFIERAQENECFLLEKKTVLKRLINQIYKPKTTQALVKTLENIDVLLNQSDAYVIKCNQDISAAKTAYEKIQ